jgi:hypothetical protein
LRLTGIAKSTVNDFPPDGRASVQVGLSAQQLKEQKKMEMQAMGKVTGFKCWKNDEDGIDSGSIFVEANLKNSSKVNFGKNNEGLAKGYASQEYKTRGSELIRRLAKVECPFTAQLVIEQETDGKGGLTQVVIDCRPVAPAADQKKAA